MKRCGDTTSVSVPPLDAQQPVRQHMTARKGQRRPLDDSREHRVVEQAQAETQDYLKGLENLGKVW